MKCLNDNELKHFLDLTSKDGSRDSILLRFIAFTGARTIEAVNVLKRDLRPGACAVFIRGRKGSRDRTVPLPADFFRELVEYTKAVADDARIFPISTRRVRQIWDKYRLNPEQGAHALRHTFGVRLYNNSADIHAVQTALGHKNIQNTMIYLEYVEGLKKLKQTTKGMWKKKLDAA